MKFGFFFGAGAEVSYGLPLGGKFAIDLFRQDNSAEKEALRSILEDDIDRTSPYATNWLPEGFFRKRIHAFGKTEFRALIESSIEYRRHIISERLNALDDLFERAVEKCGITVERVSEAFAEHTNRTFGEHTYSQTIKINPTLTNNLKLFESEFYSAVLDLVRGEGDTAQIEKYATSILQLLIGAYGQELVQKVNQEIFTEAPDDLTIFDDISGMFRLEFDKIGNTALELLLKSGAACELEDDATVHDIFLAVLREILELLFTEILDYQALIDNYWRYLYSPKEDWAKFTKMVIFLNTTRSYIQSQLDANFAPEADGYYHDLLALLDAGHEISGIGTANYNNLIQRIAGDRIPDELVYHLNGGVRDFYNPYKNTVITCADGVPPTDQIHVPFMLTQSGVKPLTSISMSRRYVELFDKLKQADVVVAIGYNFNVDDNHINGLFRQLIEDEGRTFVWIKPKSRQTENQLKKELEEKMRLPTSARDRVHIIQVHRDTRQFEQQTSWIDEIVQRVDGAEPDPA
ncbi:hypothetical protein [Henriciella sp.]|uniref:hypothetical protein n=1 Tax=Henriciella sp. TaxID=1968823 RepID=UPI00261BDD79|nr:hypothetical protein [Henriciella sp.]